ncbi:MAG: hypothetical protein B6244_00680 [Candidatus Cloacimonetes bacterium 4572_55]|nr:MAG: hypothetical protein B6244_00680 [Candidatus Cloacimonetes bacterium 4572_55]
MRCILILTLIISAWTVTVIAQPLERIIQSLPIFISCTGVKAVDGVLTVGIFSDELLQVEEATLQTLENIRVWKNEGIIKIVGIKKIKVVALNSNNIVEFKGQVIWIIDAEASLEKLKRHTMEGVFTIGAQNDKFVDYLTATQLYENKSDRPDVERWRLTQLIFNCELSPLRITGKLSNKNYFVEKGCN